MSKTLEKLLLIHPNGAWNPEAERAEVDRRMGGIPEYQRAYVARQVHELASLQRWPKLEKAVSLGWLREEREECATWVRRACEQPITADGNRAYMNCAAKAQAIEDAVSARVSARLQREAMQ